MMNPDRTPPLKRKYDFRHNQQSLHWDTPMSSEDLEIEKVKFSLMDRDQTGTIDW